MAGKLDPQHLTPQQVRDCEDEDTLLDWHDELMDVHDGIIASLEIRAPLPVTGRDWVIRAADKGAAIRAIILRLERQIINCGFDLPAASLRSLNPPRPIADAD